MGKRDSDVWLDEDDYLIHAPITLDGQLHINHVGCPAGVDRKKRLYIKRTAKGVVAFCHHCGLKGASMSTPLAESWAKLDGADTIETTRHTVRSRESALNWLDSTSLGTPSPKAGTLSGWLDKKRIPYAYAVSPVFPRCGANDFGPLDVLYLPIVGDLPNGPELCGIQTRNFNARYKGPKYVTDIWAKAPPWIYHKDGERVDTVCLTEDWASAIYLAANGLPAVPLYGTSCNDETLLHLAKTKGVKNLVVWLDNDNPEVIKAARGISRRAKLIFSGCYHYQQLVAPTDLDTSPVRFQITCLAEYFA